MEKFKKYNESSYYNSEDITEKLLNIAEIKDEEIKEELTEAICQLKAIAENPYNSDRWRILYNVLLNIIWQNICLVKGGKFDEQVYRNFEI